MRKLRLPKATQLTQLHRRETGTRAATLYPLLSHTNHRAEENTHSSNKYLLRAYWVPGTVQGTGDPAVDRTGTVPVLGELAFRVRRPALNTQYKMKR